MNTKRIEWVDCTKGIAIILVVLGHTLTYYSPNFDIGVRIIYSFHMPLFFIMTGFVATLASYDLNYLKFVKKKAVALMKPYYLYCVILLTFKIFKDIVSGSACIPGFNMVFNTLLMTRKSFVSELWFLPCLFIAHCLIYWMIKIKRPELKWCIALILAWAALTLRNKTNVALPINLDNALLAIPFILLGMEWRSWENNHKNYWIKRKLPTFFVALVAFIAMCQYEIEYSDSIIYFADLIIENVLSFVCTAIIGTTMIVEIARFALKGVNPILEKLGKNSLTIYGMHYCVLAVVFQVFQRFTKNVSGGGKMLLVIAETSVVIAVIIVGKNILLKYKKAT